MFTGQRFCRACGKPTDQFFEEHAPTVQMTDRPDTGSRRTVDTAPPSAGTSPVFNPGEYPAPPGLYTPPYIPPPPRKSKGPIAWLLGLIMVGFLAIVVIAVVFGVRQSRSGAPAARSSTETEATLRPGEVHLSEAGATVTSRETVITQTFAPTTKVQIETGNGEVRIEGTDQPQVELKIIKAGRNAEARSRVPIIINQTGLLSIRTNPHDASVKIEYILKVPRATKQVDVRVTAGEISLSSVVGNVSLYTEKASIEVSKVTGNVSLRATTGKIEAREITGEVTATTTTGSIELEDVTGPIDADTTTGRIKADIKAEQPTPPPAVGPGPPAPPPNAPAAPTSRALRFKSTTGDIDITLADDVNVDLDAIADNGQIRIDSDFGITVEKRVNVQRAAGTIGTGGQPLKINTVTGRIGLNR